jgi:CRP-like cAMP-binding protein
MNLTQLFRFETGLVAVPAGESLFRAGESGDLMYVLMHGTAVVTIGTITVERAEPGAILGELALVEHAPRSATVTALIDCEFLPIDAKRFQFLVQQTPNFSLHVMKVMAERLRRTGLMLQAASVERDS